MAGHHAAIDPKFMLECEGETLHEKSNTSTRSETDRRDASAIAAAGKFESVQAGNVIDDEQSHGWAADVCERASQGAPVLGWRAEHPNLCQPQRIAYLLLPSAVNEFDDAVRNAGAASPPRKLAGMTMFSNIYVPRSGHEQRCLLPDFLSSKTRQLQ